MSLLTKKALTDTFLTLLEESPLDKITVKDITEKCGVNRNTFYYYYKDIYDLLDEVFREETNRVLEDGRVFKSWQESFMESTAFAMEHKKVIYHVYNSMSREHVERYLYSVTDKLMLHYVEIQANGMDIPKEDQKFVSDFFKYALVGTALDWINKGMKDDPNQFIRKFGELFEGNIRSILQKCK